MEFWDAKDALFAASTAFCRGESYPIFEQIDGSRTLKESITFGYSDILLHFNVVPHTVKSITMDLAIWLLCLTYTPYDADLAPSH